MRRILLAGLVAFNVLLALALLGGTITTQVPPSSPMDCCKEEAGSPELSYCCMDCCWLTSDCESDEDCTCSSHNGMGR